MARRGEASPHRAECGTAAAYKAHLSKNEEPCEECREHNRLYAQRRRDAIKDGTLNVRIPLKALRRLFEVAPIDVQYEVRPDISNIVGRYEYNWENRPDGRSVKVERH